MDRSEDIIAVNNLAEILTVDHIDVFHVAYADLAQSMGYLHDLGNPVVKEVTEGAIKQIIAAGRVCGDYPPPMRRASPWGEALRRNHPIFFFYLISSIRSSI